MTEKKFGEKLTFLVLETPFSTQKQACKLSGTGLPGHSGPDSIRKDVPRSSGWHGKMSGVLGAQGGRMRLTLWGHFGCFWCFYGHFGLFWLVWGVDFADSTVVCGWGGFEFQKLKCVKITKNVFGQFGFEVWVHFGPHFFGFWKLEKSAKMHFFSEFF